MIVDGKEELSYAETKTDKNRTLTIPLVNGNHEIEIIGANASRHNLLSSYPKMKSLL